MRMPMDRRWFACEQTGCPDNSRVVIVPLGPRRKNATGTHIDQSMSIMVQFIRSKKRISHSHMTLQMIGSKTRAARQLALCLLPVLFTLGCEPELQSTRRLDPEVQKVQAQQDDRRSNSGSLRDDSSTDQPLRPEDIIRPGDQVQVMVWGHPEFNTTTTVKSYGTITVPLVGDVIAEGMTENQLSRELKQRLSDYIKGDARINISHVSMNNRISVMGAVNKQGNYSALGQVSLVEVISDAGGTTVTADLRHVKIFREGKKQNVEEVNLQRHLEDGSLMEVPEVKPGDTIFVPSEENLIREIASYGQDMLVLFGFFALLH